MNFVRRVEELEHWVLRDLLELVLVASRFRIFFLVS